jgi:glyoxylase-like metal-dependent hydrolase (beta-lactamase superfamily II)
MHPDHAGGNNQFDIAYKGTKEPTTGWGVNPAKETIGLPEGHSFDLGSITVEVIDIPGHTPGSIGLLWVEKKIMLSGDAVNQQVWLHLDNSMPLSVFRDSMQHLIDISDRWEKLYFSHGEGDLIYDLALVMGLKKRADSIISGKKVGDPAETHLGHKAMLYMEDGYGFYYDPNKLVA